MSADVNLRRPHRPADRRTEEPHVTDNAIDLAMVRAWWRWPLITDARHLDDGSLQVRFVTYEMTEDGTAHRAECWATVAPAITSDKAIR